MQEQVKFVPVPADTGDEYAGTRSMNNPTRVQSLTGKFVVILVGINILSVRLRSRR